MIRFSSIFCVLFSIFIVTGCGSITKSTRSSDFSASTPQLVASPDSVSAMLADAADRASKALETLAAVEYSKTSDISIAPISNAPVELRRAITVNWVGPVEIITKKMADRAGYRFVVLGAHPPVPTVVSINVENKPVIDVLRDIGLQLGLRGNVNVDSVLRIVEIYYPSNVGVGGL